MGLLFACGFQQRFLEEILCNRILLYGGGVMKRVSLIAGTFEYDDQFMPIIIQAIMENKTGTLFNPFDNCVIFMDSILAVEDENGDMIDVSQISL